MPNLVLLPAAANVIKIPMLASGGFGDARGLVAALALGCEGINMGTRFTATVEAPIHRQREAGPGLDRRALRPIADLPHHAQHQRASTRNSVAKKAIEMEHEGKTIQEIGPIVAGTRGKVVYETGDLEHGIWSAGTVMGLIKDIPTCKELVERIVGEADAIVDQRLASMRG